MIKHHRTGCTPPADDDELRALLESGARDHRAGNLLAATEAYEAVLRRDPRNVNALNLLGALHGAEGRLDSAVTLLQAAIQADETFAQAWFNLGLVTHRLNKTEFAERCLRVALAQEPNLIDGWVALGDVLVALGDREASEKAYRQALDIDPDHIVARNNLAVMLAESQRPQEAAALQASILRGDGQAHETLPIEIAHDQAVNAALIFTESGADTDALAACRVAVALMPESAEAQFTLGQLLMKQRKYSEAAAAFDAALAIAPNYAEARVALGILEERRGRAAEALMQFAIAVRDRPDFAIGHFRYAMALQACGQTAAALAAFRAYLAQDPDDAEGASLHIGRLTGEIPPHAPDAYIARMFDAFAPKFDRHLVGSLGYAVPEGLAALLAKSVLPPNNATQWRTALDLGCGTGLCGVAIRPYVAYLEGVDIAPMMIAAARKRRDASDAPIYDSLFIGEIIEHLAAVPARFDLILAADVLVYRADLGAIFIAAASALTPGGVFAFNVEILDPLKISVADNVADNNAINTGVALCATLRFAHTRDHLHSRAHAAGLVLEHMEEAPLRVEAGVMENGLLVVLRRQAVAA